MNLRAVKESAVAQGNVRDVRDELRLVDGCQW